MSRNTRSLLIYLFSLLLAGYAGFLLRQHYGFFTGEADTVIGRVERVYLRDARFGTPGRMDTGAGVTSLGVEIVEIKKPKKNGDPERVVFRMLDEKAKIQTLDREIIDWQNIRKKAAKAFSSARWSCWIYASPESPSRRGSTLPTAPIISTRS